MATAARSTGLAKHLIDFCASHIEVHGKTESARLYIKANISLWRETYGDTIADEVQKVIARYWADKKAGPKKSLA